MPNEEQETNQSEFNVTPVTSVTYRASNGRIFEKGDEAAQEELRLKLIALFQSFKLQLTPMTLAQWCVDNREKFTHLFEQTEKIIKRANANARKKKTQPTIEF